VVSNLTRRETRRHGRVQISVGNISSRFEVTSGAQQRCNLSRAYVYITQLSYWVCYLTLQLFTFHGQPYKLYAEIKAVHNASCVGIVVEIVGIITA